MKTKHTYTTPASKTLELKPQGLLCWSDPSGSLFFLNMIGDNLGGDRDDYSMDTNVQQWY